MRRRMTDGRRAVAIDMQSLSLREMQALIGAWGDETFPAPQSNYKTVLAHLIAETEELRTMCALIALCEYVPQGVVEEIADVAILTMQLAHRLGIDLALAVAAKHETNLTRTWTYDPEAGFSRHDEEASRD